MSDAADEQMDLAALEHVTEVQVSAGRKQQLDQYEPINEHVTLTLEFSEDDSVMDKRNAIENAQDAAWTQAEQGVAQRYEQHVRQDE